VSIEIENDLRRASDMMGEAKDRQRSREFQGTVSARMALQVDAVDAVDALHEEKEGGWIVGSVLGQ